MDTNRIHNSMGQLVLVGLLLSLAGCSGGGDNGPDCRYDENWVNGQCKVNFELPPIVIPDGIFRGIDPRGRNVTALISRFSEIRYIDGFGRVGSGTISVGNNNIVGSGIELVAAYGDTFSDGSRVADCLLSGTLVERKSLTLSKECTTSAGLQFDEDLILTFDPLYDRNSSMGIVAGLYEMPSGDILDIGPDGTLFSQSPNSGCVTSGTITLVVSFANLYDFQFDTANCQGIYADWNGAAFEGLATIDTRNSRDVLLIAAAGQVDGNAVSIVAENTKL